MVYHIEFLGPSGTGKTTLRQELISQLPNALGGVKGKYECCHRASSLAPLFKYWPKQLQEQFWKQYLRPRFWTEYKNAHPEIFQARQELTKIVRTDDIGFHVDRQMALYQLYASTARPNEPVVIDDGLYQFHVQLIKHNVYDSLAAFLPLPDVLICTRASPETCLKRQDSRGRGRAKLFDGLDRETAIKQLDKTAQATNRVAADLEDRDTIVIQVSTENSIKTVRERILNQMP